MTAACSALAIFCDDVRHEVSNKISMIGVYSADIRFTATPPILYPKLCIVVWVYGPLVDIPDKMAIRVLALPGRTELFGAEIQKPGTVSEGSKVRVQTVIVISPLGVKSPGALIVEVDLGTETLNAGQLDILFQNPAETAATSASEPPPPA